MFYCLLKKGSYVSAQCIIYLIARVYLILAGLQRTLRQPQFQRRPQNPGGTGRGTRPHAGAVHAGEEQGGGERGGEERWDEKGRGEGGSKVEDKCRKAM